MTLSDTRARWLALVVLCLGDLMIVLDTTIVNVALPSIRADLGFSETSLAWVVNAYLLTFGGFLLLGGRLGDLFGHRRLFLIGLVLFTLASVACGLSTTKGLLVGARAVQGLGGALLFPSTLSLVNTLFREGPDRNRALAVWGGAGASGLSLGSLLGGVLTSWFGWEAVFFVNVPLAVGAALASAALIPADRERERGRSFDLPGAVTATAGVALLVFSLVQAPESGWTSPEVVTALAASVVLLGAFIVIEARGRDPLMPLRLLAHRTLSGAMTITFIFLGTFGSLFYVLTIYLQEVRGYHALETGLAFLAPSVVIAAGTQIGERMATRGTPRATLLVGFLLGATGTALLAARIGDRSGYLALAPEIALYALGQGISWTAMWIAAAEGVDSREQGVASGMASTTFQVGGAVGLALLVAISNPGLGGTGEALRGELAAGLQDAAYVAAIGMALGAGVAALLLKPAARPSVTRAGRSPRSGPRWRKLPG
jgi:EmrB/QacA subfamily drug resistance transporter